MLSRIAEFFRSLAGKPAPHRPSSFRRPSGATVRAEALGDADARVLERAARGHTFRPDDAAEESFDALVERLRTLRERGLLELDERHVMHAQEGGYLMAGPCAITDAGRSALEADRLLGPRAPGS